MKARDIIQAIKSGLTYNEGKVETVDYNSISQSINDMLTSELETLAEKSKPDLEKLNKDAVSTFLKDKGFDSMEAFDTSIKDSANYKEKYETIQNERKQDTLTKGIAKSLSDLKIEDKHSKVITKLLNTDELYGEEGELLEDKLQESIKTIVTDDLALELEGVKIGGEPGEPADPKKTESEFTKAWKKMRNK